MPQAPSGAVTTEVSLIFTYGRLTKSSSFSFLYQAPLSGPAIILSASPTRDFTNVATISFNVEIGNFPVIPAPLTAGLSKITMSID
eukprot:224749-Hanusia_phi.AAC.1